MDKKRCKAVKLNKEQCTRPVPRDSKYCWQHRLSRLDDARWYNNTKSQGCMGVAGLVLTLAVFGISQLLGPTKADQKEISQQIASHDKKFPDTSKPALTKEDAQRPLCAEEKNLLAEYEKWIRVAEGAKIKAQLGATITHRVLTDLFNKRGVKLERTYQLNTGGNTDFLNMHKSSRVASKRISKTEAVQSVTTNRLADRNIHIDPSDYVPRQNHHKVCFIMIGENPLAMFR